MNDIKIIKELRSRLSGKQIIFSNQFQASEYIKDLLAQDRKLKITTRSGITISLPNDNESIIEAIQQLTGIEYDETILEKNTEEFIDSKTDEPTRAESVIKEMKQYGNWYLVKQLKGKNFKYVVQVHIRGDSAHIDLRIEANGHLIGITLNTPEVVEGEKKPQKDLVETRANKFLYPRSPSLRKNFQILTELKLVQPKIWLKVQGKIPAGGVGATKFKPAEFKILSTGTARFGTQKTDFHEWFLTPDGKNQWDNNIKGRWVQAWIPRPEHFKRAGQGKMMWGFFRPNNQKQYIDTHKFEKEAAKAVKEKIDMIWQGTNGEDFQIISGKGNLPKGLK